MITKTTEVAGGQSSSQAARREAMTRRTAFRVMIGSGVVGAALGTGISALSGFREPSATFAGEDEWQITLIESGRIRALLLIGIAEGSIDETITRMMGSFRQRIDLVIGTPHALAPLDPTFRSRWKVLRTVVLDSGGGRSRSSEIMPVTSPVSIDLGARLRISLTPVIYHLWRLGEESAASQRWIVSASSNGSTVRMAERLEDIAATSLGPAALVVAPRGDLRKVWSFSPASAIAVNGDQVPPDVVRGSADGAGGERWLVSVFPEDLSRVTFLDHAVGLPTTGRRVQFIDRAR